LLVGTEVIPEERITVAQMVAFAETFRIAARAVLGNHPELLAAVLRRTLELAGDSIAPPRPDDEADRDAAPCDREPAAIDQDAELDDAAQSSIAGDPPDTCAAAALNGVHGGGDELLLEEPV
jgi:hypothetical protein